MGVLSVLLAAMACYAVGAIYYMTLSKQWMEAAGKTEADIDASDKKPFIIAAIVSILAAGMMRHILAMSGVVTLGKGVLVGAGIGAFIVGAWIFLNNGYEGKTTRLSIINTGYAILGLAVMGAVLSFF